MGQRLLLDARRPASAANAGLFISRGVGRHPARRIDSHELILVRSGVLGIREGDQVFEVRESETLLLFPGLEHCGTHDYSPELSFYWVHFKLPRGGGGRGRQHDGRGRLHGGRRWLSIPQHGRPRRPQRLMELMHRFFEEQQSPRLGRAPLDLLITLMLCEAADSLPPGGRDGVGGGSLWAQAEAYIAGHSHEEVSTRAVAAALDCNPDYLGHVFRAARGKTLTQAIHEKRLEDARRLLLESAQPIRQVARSCGFRTPGYFRRLFLRQEGITPRQYRQLHHRVHINWR